MLPGKFSLSHINALYQHLILQIPSSISMKIDTRTIYKITNQVQIDIRSCYNGRVKISIIIYK